MRSRVALLTNNRRGAATLRSAKYEPLQSLRMKRNVGQLARKGTRVDFARGRGGEHRVTIEGDASTGRR